MTIDFFFVRSVFRFFLYIIFVHESYCYFASTFYFLSRFAQNFFRFRFTSKRSKYKFENTLQTDNSDDQESKKVFRRYNFGSSRDFYFASKYINGKHPPLFSRTLGKFNPRTSLNRILFSHVCTLFLNLLRSIRVWEIHRREEQRRLTDQYYLSQPQHHLPCKKVRNFNLEFR